jgi:hypothetical protein
MESLKAMQLLLSAVTPHKVHVMDDGSARFQNSQRLFSDAQICVVVGAPTVQACIGTASSCRQQHVSIRRNFKDTGSNNDPDIHNNRASFGRGHAALHGDTQARRPRHRVTNVS